MEKKDENGGCTLKIFLALITTATAICVATIGILPEILDRLEANSSTPSANSEPSSEEVQIQEGSQNTDSSVFINPTTVPEPTLAPTFTSIPPPTSTSPPPPTDPPPTDPPSPTEISLPAGSVSYYTFSGNGTDSSGNNTAIIQGATFTTDRNGNSNSALLFDGVDDYVQLPNEAAFDFAEFTIIIWLKFNDLRSVDDWIISKGPLFGNFSITRTGSNAQFWAGYAGYAHVIQGGNWSSVASQAPLPIGQFFCLAISLDSSTFRSYLNGQLVRSAGNISPPVFNDNPVYIGAGGYNTVSEYFNGVVDEVQFYSRVLSDAEIARQCR